MAASRAEKAVKFILDAFKTAPKKTTSGKLYKTTFYRTVSNGKGGHRFEQTEGYAQDYTASDGTAITICVSRVGKTWYATERSTGLGVGLYGPTRKAVYDQIDAQKVDTFVQALKKAQKFQAELAEYCR